MRDKLKFIFILLTAAISLNSWSQSSPNADGREFYELRTYYYKDSTQEKAIDRYLGESLLPALHRSGFTRVGVFKLLADTVATKMIFLLLPMTSLEQLTRLPASLERDKAYMASAKEWLEAGFDKAPYSRFESVIMHAFAFMPKLEKPKLNGPSNDRVYELRSYESATERLARKKVQMFNEGGEIELFKRLGFNAIFYGEVISGSQMPNLMYMTSFVNRSERDAHWKTFGADPEWKKLSAMPEYKNTVSHIDISFLQATDYSDL
jgi:hypothetical protein